MADRRRRQLTKRDKTEGVLLFLAMVALGATGIVIGGKFAALGMLALYFALMFGLCFISIIRANR